MWEQTSAWGAENFEKGKKRGKGVKSSFKKKGRAGARKFGPGGELNGLAQIVDPSFAVEGEGGDFRGKKHKEQRKLPLTN